MSNARLDGKVISGELRQRIRIEQPVLSDDGLGGHARSWEEVTTVWAHIHPVSRRERLVDGQLSSVVTHRIVIRYRSGITAAMRVLFGNRVFTIRAVIQPEHRKTTLEILAAEGVAS